MNKYDGVIIIEGTDTTGNIDPNTGESRKDEETGQALMSDACTKYKIRRSVERLFGSKAPYRIFIADDGAILNDKIEEALASLPGHDKSVKREKDRDRVGAARAKMCADYWDVRTFGAVMSTGGNAGKVTGPVQLAFARSVSPVQIMHNSLTRCCVTAEADRDKDSTFGNKPTMPYVLYRQNIFINAMYAEKTGFSAKDLDILLYAISNMYENLRAASSGTMTVRGIHLFRHDSPNGNDHAHLLLERVKTEAKVAYPRQYSDYSVRVDLDGLSPKVTYVDAPTSCDIVNFGL